MLDPDLSIQGRGERSLSGQKHQLHSVSYIIFHRLAVLTRRAVSVSELLHQGSFLIRPKAAAFLDKCNLFSILPLCDPNALWPL